MSFEQEIPNGQKKNAEGLWTKNSVRMAFQDILYYSTLYYIALYCIMLYCIVLCCIILYYIV